MFRTHKHFYQDNDINYPIYDLDLPFSQYIEKCKDIISQYRPDLANNENANTIIDANTPYELKPFRSSGYGALLIHGLLDSPLIMKDIADHLRNEGLLVRSLLLPGHGTIPGDLLNTDYRDWIQTVQYGIASLANKVNKIFIVGFSTGATLGIYQVLQDPSLIAGLLLFSPAYKIRTQLDFVTDWHRYLSWFYPRAGWLHVSPEIDYAKYRSVCFNSAYQVYLLAKQVNKLDHHTQPPCPVFMALSNEDRIVSSKASIANFNFYTNPLNKMILYKSHPTAYSDPRIIVRPSTYPEWNVKNFSHICIPVSPNNSHYGRYGDYEVASRVDEQKDVLYCALNRPEKFWYDRLYEWNLVKYKRERLTFNPDFHFMAMEMSQFLKSVM